MARVEQIGVEPDPTEVAAYNGGTRRFPETPVATPVVTKAVLQNMLLLGRTWREHGTAELRGDSLDRVVRTAHGAHVAAGFIHTPEQSAEDEARLRWLAPFTYELVRSVGTNQILGLLDGELFDEIGPLNPDDPRLDRVQNLFEDENNIATASRFARLTASALLQREGSVADLASEYRRKLADNLNTNRGDRDAIFAGAMILRGDLAVDLRPHLIRELHDASDGDAHPNLEAWVDNGLLYKPAASLIEKYPPPAAV